MTKAKKEHYKYIVFNAAYLLDLFLSSEEAAAALETLSNEYHSFRKVVLGKEPSAYIVCNQDEPYAEKVWQVILEGEDEKLSPLPPAPDRSEDKEKYKKSVETFLNSFEDLTKQLNELSGRLSGVKKN